MADTDRAEAVREVPESVLGQPYIQTKDGERIPCAPASFRYRQWLQDPEMHVPSAGGDEVSAVQGSPSGTLMENQQDAKVELRVVDEMGATLRVSTVRGVTGPWGTQQLYMCIRHSGDICEYLVLKPGWSVYTVGNPVIA